VGDGFDYSATPSPSPLPLSLNAYVAKPDYNLTKDGNHRLFVRGIMNNDRQAERNISTTQLPETEASSFRTSLNPRWSTTINKGFTVGYTAILQQHAGQQFLFWLYKRTPQLAGPVPESAPLSRSAAWTPLLLSLHHINTRPRAGEEHRGRSHQGRGPSTCLSGRSELQASR